MKKQFALGLTGFLFLLGGCNQSEVVTDIKDVTEFSTENDGNYLLFHLIDPFKEEGYIAEVDESGDDIKKHLITDSRFAPADVFLYEEQFFFVSGGYSNDNKVMSYNPQDQKITMNDTFQEDFVDKFYKNGDQEYIITSYNQDNRNSVCDINAKKCVSIADGYIALDVTVLDGYIIVVGIDEESMDNKEDVTLISKYDGDLNLIEETTLDLIPGYSSYTSTDQSLYLFMINGEIVEVNSNLETTEHTIDLPSQSNEYGKVFFNKIERLKDESLVMNTEIQESEDSSDFLAHITFENGEPSFTKIEDSEGESVINTDAETGDVYTRSYVDNKAVIKIRDSNDLTIKHVLNLETDDPIYFVDSID